MTKKKPGPKKGEAQQKRWQWILDGMATTGNDRIDAAIRSLKNEKELTAAQIGQCAHDILKQYYAYPEVEK